MIDAVVESSTQKLCLNATNKHTNNHMQVNDQDVNHFHTFSNENEHNSAMGVSVDQCMPDVQLHQQPDQDTKDPNVCKPILNKKIALVNECRKNKLPVQALIYALTSPPYDCPDDEIRKHTDELVWTCLGELPVPNPKQFPMEINDETAENLMRYSFINLKLF